MNRVILLPLLLITSLSAFEPELEVSTTLQPLVEIKEEEKSTDDKAAVSLHRAKVSMRLDRSFPAVKVNGEISLDFAEAEFANILKQASIGVQIHNAFTIKAGKIKSPFGLESAMSSRKVPFIRRGELSSFIREDLGISGYQTGLSISGELEHKKLRYALSLYNYSGYSDEAGGSREQLRSLVSLPMLNLEFSPIKKLSLSYSLALPYAGAVEEESVGDIYLCNSLGVQFSHKNYALNVEQFIGPSSEKQQEMATYLGNLSQSVSSGTALSNSFKIPISSKLATLLSARFEYLNGLKFDDDELEDRSFYYTMTGGVKLSYRKNFSIAINLDDKFDKEFQSTNDKRLGIELTGNLKWKSRTKKERLPSANLWSFNE